MSLDQWFHYKRTYNHGFDTKLFFVKFSGCSFELHICKPCYSSFGTHFQIQESQGMFWKPSQVFMYTLDTPQAILYRYEVYNKSKLEIA
jgi:hypothetical protein